MKKVPTPNPTVITTPPSLNITVGLKRLLDNEAFVKKITVAAPEFEELLAQIQRDVVSEGNMSSIGPMCYALKEVQEAIILFSARGEVILGAETRASQKRTSKP